MIDKLKKNISWVLLGVISILGLIARLNLINKSSFWYDEAFSGVLVKQDFSSIVRIIIEDKVHPPIYYFLLKLWATIVGNTDITLRLFSVIFGMALVIASYFLIKKILNKKAALIVAGLFSLSPYFILYSLEARSYIMLGFEALIAIYFFVVIYKKDFKSIKELLKIKEIKWLVAIAVLMLLTHYLGLVLIAVMGLLFFIKIYPKLEKYIWILLVAALLIILAKGLLNNGDYRIYPKALVHTKWLEDAQPLTIGEMLYAFLFGVQSQALGKQNVFSISFIKDLTAVFITILTLSIVLGINYAKRKQIVLSAISKLFLLNILVTTIFCLFGVNIFVPRYVMYIAVVFVVWIGSIVSQWNFKAIIAAIVVYFILLTQVVWVNYNRHFTDLDEINLATARTRVVVQSPFDYLVLKYYLGDNRNLYYLDDSSNTMRNWPWPFFEKSQILDRTIKTDRVI